MPLDLSPELAIGLQAHISMVGVRLEYEGFTVPRSSGPRIASLSVFMNF